MRRTQLFVAAVAVVLAVGIETAASAQLFTHVYPTKVVCGFKEGNIPPLSSFPGSPPREYEDLKPGNYATTVNVFHSELITNRLQAYIQLPNGRLTLLRPWDARSFVSEQFSCPEIAAALGLSVGSVFDGWLLLFSTSDDFQVSPVYTFESQNGFYDTQHWEVGPNFIAPLGPYAINWFNPRITGPTFDPFFPPWPIFFPAGSPTPPPPSGQVTQRHVVAAGRGGLGLGASIDVETVEPRRLDEPVTADTLSDMSL